MRRALLIVLLSASVWSCAPVASSEQRALRDAAAAHLAEQGFEQKISSRSLEVTEEVLDFATNLPHCFPRERELRTLVHRLMEANSAQRFWTTRESFRALRTIGSDFHEDLPTDHLELSLASVDEAKGTALIYVERHCPLCGFGMFHLLERRGGRWEVKGECHIWVS